MGNKKKILFVSSGPNLIDPMTGTDNRLHNLVIQLSKRNEVIALISKEYIKRSSNNPPFKVYGFKMGSSPFLADLNINFFITLLRILRNEQINIIYIAFPQGVITSKLLCRLLGLDIPIVYDAQKVEGDSAKEFGNPNLSFLKRLGLPYYIPLLERIAIKIANHVISVSNIDKSRFVEKYNLESSKVSVIPSGVNVQELSWASSNKDYIAPEIYKKYKNSVFLIAGKDLPVFEKGNVKSVGFVGDIYSFLNIADIAIAPLFHGGGTKLKIFDYMGVGLPIVTTKKGIEGIEAENSKHVMVVDNVDEKFINAINYLIENEDERKRLGRNARKLAEDKYDWEKIGERLNSLYERLVEEE
jgi:glycosyltransferase involved in cell wall biosynthesis